MWIIAGSLPDPDFGLLSPLSDPAPAARLEQDHLVLRDGRRIPVERGTAALAASCLAACTVLNLTPPELALTGDTGSGEGSRALYAMLTEQLAALQPQGIMFHYLFPDVDWHNRILMAVQALPVRPLLLADAGFMYVAKMSGYAAEYDLFTPDVGELAFLADEKAPHPFYTRGFLLQNDHDVLPLLERIRSNGHSPRHLLVKGQADYIVEHGEIIATVDSPSEPAMECIGGTGDIVAGLATAFLIYGLSPAQAALTAARAARLLARHCHPRPDTQAGELIRALPDALSKNLPQLRLVRQVI